MAKQNVAEQETLGEAMNKTELFFERNGRTMSYVFLGLLVLAALVFGYRCSSSPAPRRPPRGSPRRRTVSKARTPISRRRCWATTTRPVSST